MTQQMIIAVMVGFGAGWAVPALVRQWGGQGENIGPIAWFLMAAPFPAVPVWAYAVLVDDPLVFWATNVLGWTLCVLALVDARTGYLPDIFTVPLLLLGLAVTLTLTSAHWENQLWGAVGGYLSFALLALTYRITRGRDGLGLGDAKLLAAGGAWCGLGALPSIAFLGALFALSAAVATAFARRQALRGREAIRFGPHLALAIWAVWLYGPLLLF